MYPEMPDFIKAHGELIAYFKQGLICSVAILGRVDRKAGQSTVRYQLGDYSSIAEMNVNSCSKRQSKQYSMIRCI